MLVLTRKQGQTITIGDEIEITVVEVRGDQMRIGIRAPRNVSIVRGELLEAINRENREAAGADPSALDALAGLAEPSTEAADGD